MNHPILNIVFVMANIWIEQSTTKHHSGSDRAGGFSQSIPLSIIDHLSIEVLQQNHTVPSRNHYLDPAPAALWPDSDQIRHCSIWGGVVWQCGRTKLIEFHCLVHLNIARFPAHGLGTTTLPERLSRSTRSLQTISPPLLVLAAQCYMRHQATKSLTTLLTSWFDHRFKWLATTEWRRVAFLSVIDSVATFCCRA